MHAGSAKCVSNCLSLIINNIDTAREFVFHIKDNCAWLLHSLKSNVLSAPGTSTYVLWKIIPLDKKELEYTITFAYLDCSGIQRAKAGLVSRMVTGDGHSLPRKEAVEAVVSLHLALIWKLRTGPLSFQATPSKVIYLSFVQTSLLSPFFQSPAPQGNKGEAQTTVSDFSYFLPHFGGRRRIFRGLRVAKGTGHRSDVLGG